MILGNKCDLEAVVTEEEAEELARSLQERSEVLFTCASRRFGPTFQAFPIVFHRFSSFFIGSLRPRVFERAPFRLQARQLRCSALDGENVSEALRQLAERLLRRRAVYGPPAQVYGPPLAAPGPRCCVLGPEGFVGERDREAMALRARDLEVGGGDVF